MDDHRNCMPDWRSNFLFEFDENAEQTKQQMYIRVCVFVSGCFFFFMLNLKQANDFLSVGLHSI